MFRVFNRAIISRFLFYNLIANLLIGFRIAKIDDMKNSTSKDQITPEKDAQRLLAMIPRGSILLTAQAYFFE